MDERDSRQYRSQDHLASTVHRETFHNNTAQAGKHRWDGVRDVLHRLTGKSKRRGNFVTKFKGSNHHNPR
ncbi:hypothetical protein scyTo_0013320 [Scyliorhinus torazame]|uniref:Uncharacterized protein n=2 Tax=Scyliorhinus torazame TaxID=75743 RepID=A0A401NTZ4_SCYTO|nr:hypothetical protein [Scyliorhinus torazame]